MLYSLTTSHSHTSIINVKMLLADAVVAFYISELLSPIVFFVKPGVCCALLFLRSQLFDIPQHYQFIQWSKNGGNKSNEIFFLCSSNIENTFDLFL